jgi:putative sterol carrier protein
MKNVDPEKVVRKYIDAKDNHRWNELLSYLDPEYTSTDPAIPKPVKGHEAISQYFPMLENVGMKTRILMIASKNMDVAAELEVVCTIKGDKEAALSFPVKMAKFYRVNAQGFLVEEREYSNPAAKFESLGPDAAAKFQAIGGEAAANFQTFTQKVASEFEVLEKVQDFTLPVGGMTTIGEVTPQSIFKTKIPENLKANAQKLSDTKAVCQFAITGNKGGSWYIDLTVAPPAIFTGISDKANCTITCTDDEFVKIVTGKTNGDLAFMTGKVKISGDFRLASTIRALIR